MSRNLIPELHDIAKLWGITDALRKRFAIEGTSSQRELPLMPARLGLAAPMTRSWRGVVDQASEAEPNELDLFLLKVADHGGAALGRGARTRLEPIYKTVHRLWNPNAARPLESLGTEAEVRDLLEWLVRLCSLAWLAQPECHQKSNQ